MSALFRPMGLGLIATLPAGVVLFAAFCHLHALTVGLELPWTVSTWWGLVAGAPAGGLAFALWRWRDLIGSSVSRTTLAAAVFGAALVWGMLARGVIAPWRSPDALEFARQFFVVAPVAAAFAGAAAISRCGPVVAEAPTSWIELPEEPLLRLRAEEVGWISAAGNYCEFHAAGRTYLVRIPLMRAAARLQAHGFARAHRSALVNLASLLSVEPGGAGKRLVARMRCGAVVPVGARHRDALLAAMSARSSRI